jgi:hypothetical protein
MPRFDLELANDARAAIAIVRAGEITRVSGGPSISKEWSATRIEALYELAYLRVFAAWEMYLEAIFYRSLCGYASAHGQETLVSGGHYPSLAAAETAVLGRNSYLLWQNPHTVIQRCQSFIRSGPGCPSIQEITIASNLSRLVSLASTRHRIVHNQTDARRKFDAATVLIAGRTYPSSRPGKFLRDYDTSSAPPRRWLDVTIGELTAMARQIV